jgi:hypothetical protein
MLTINFKGAQVLLALLNSTSKGSLPAETEIQEVLTKNKFFMDFYSRWKGVTHENLVETMCRFNQPDFEPSSPVLSALAKGFKRAIEENERLQANMDLLRAANQSAIVGRVLTYTPRRTPLQSVIHITIDGFNGGFQYQGQMGWSLLNDITNPAQFEAGIAHELHHIGFAYWVERDPSRQALLNEKSGCAVAVRHVQNLLSEGLAMFYCSPDMMREDCFSGVYASKLASYRKGEHHLYAQAENILALSLKPDADFDTCQQALEAIAIDLDGLLPVAHYLGARMIETMNQYHPLERIVECVQSLPHFLPLYNQAAQEIGSFVYTPSVVEQFSRIFMAENAD